MKPKQKQQSSLFAFFSKPKAAAVCGTRKHQTFTKEIDDTSKDDDVNDAIIEPSSPQLGGDSKNPICNTTVVSPQAIEGDDAVILQDTEGTSRKSIVQDVDFDDEKNEDETVSILAISAAAKADASSKDIDSNSESDDEDPISPKKSAYELLREQNIARNNARLKSLGLLTDASVSQKQIAKKKTVKRKKAGGNVDVVSYPTRRSTRRRKTVLGDHEDRVTNLEGVENEEHFKQDEIEQEQFTVSPLFEYNMSDVNQFTKFAYTSEADGREAGGSKTLVPCGPRLIPPSGLNAIYSLQFYPGLEFSGDGDEGRSYRMPSWLVGAGKSGIVALWNCRRQSTASYEGIDPVVSWKAHGGRWVADARFLRNLSSSINNKNSTNEAPTQLLTAANDGTICHWDLTSTSITTGAPKLLGQTNKSLHSSGIFSMDIRVESTSGVTIASGSKDKTIALSKLDRFGDAYWRSDFHSAKVGCVSLSSSNANPLIASASDDGLVAVHDSRMNGLGDSSTAALKIDNAHFKPHSAIWQPGSDSIFMTAGLDDVIKLWDSKNVSRPLALFHGHVPGNGKKIKRIHRPAFLTLTAGGAYESFILSGGEGSHSVSMFELNNTRNDGILHHSVFSRGKLRADIGDIGSLAVQNGCAAIAVEGGEVLLLSPRVLNVNL